MALEVVMPKLGATMEQGKILQWYKAEGDAVEKGEPILEIMTDKINIDVEAEASGHLLKTLFSEDAEVPVNTVIGYIGAEGEHIDAASQASSPTANASNGTEAGSAVADGAEATDAAAGPVADDTNHSLVHQMPGRTRATPAARKLARQNNIDLNRLTGRGPRGRIQRADVVEALENQPLGTDQTVKTAGALMPITSQPMPDSDSIVPVQGIRKVVGERMSLSVQTAPHVTLTCEVEADACVRLRERLLPVIEKAQNVRLSLTHLLIYAAAHTLRRHPLLNATFNGDEIVVHKQVNVGMAAAIADGLVVPVIKGADQKGLAETAVECHRLSHAARDKRLHPDDMTGGTFTVSNLGMYRVDAFTPIINPGESAILGVGRIHEKVVAVKGEVKVASVLTLSLSFDHRTVDGAPAAAFLTDLAAALENPEQLLL